MPGMQSSGRTCCSCPWNKRPTACSPDVPTTVDKSGGGATMISGGRPEGWINRMVMTFNKEARRIKQAHPDLTHVAFA